MFAERMAPFKLIFSSRTPFKNLSKLWPLHVCFLDSARLRLRPTSDSNVLDYTSVTSVLGPMAQPSQPFWQLNSVWLGSLIAGLGPKCGSIWQKPLVKMEIGNQRHWNGFQNRPCLWSCRLLNQNKDSALHLIVALLTCLILEVQ